MTSQDPKARADEENVPGSQHDDTPQDQEKPTERGGPGSDPKLPETEDDDGEQRD